MSIPSGEIQREIILRRRDVKYFKPTIFILLVVVAAVSFIMTSCSSSSSSSTSSATGATSSSGSTATGTPIKISYNDGFTGFMSMDAVTTDHGIKTALTEWNYTVAGHPIEYKSVDNGSDAVAAVDKARQSVESDKVNVIFGPVFSPATQAITGYLAGAGGIPDISIFGQPHDNLTTANGLAFIPAGMHSFQGYILGVYSATKLGYKTANIINYEESTGHDIADGFTRGFTESGGKIISTKFVDESAIDFSAYLTNLPPADCTSFWIFGSGAGPFVKQYHDYGIKAPLVMELADDIQEPVLKDLGDISLGIIATDHYIPLIDNPLNTKFVNEYTKQWNGEEPNMDSFGGWMAVNLFLNGVKKTNGDVTPKTIIDAMSTMSMDTPAGQYTISPYQNAFIGTGDFYICKSVKIGDRYTWQTVDKYSQVKFEDKR